jgi:predicted PurR-regulated permease PerM
METLITFGLGAGTVLIIIGVMAVFKLVRQTRELIKQVADIEIVLGRSEEMLYRRISEEVDKTDNQMQNLYSVMDSRFDKFEARLLNKRVN